MLQALAFALGTSAAGVGILNELVNPLTALLGLANIVIYSLVYTPLKPRTSLCTLVGAICGALPPIMGWTGAGNSISLGAMLLGTILFLWQIPHFLSLVWVCRDDYAKAGFRMLPLIDPGGHLTCLMIVLYSLALLPLGLAVTFAGLAGYLFAAVSLLLGLGLFLLAVQLPREDAAERPPGLPRQSRLSAAVDAVHGSRRASAGGSNLTKTCGGSRRGGRYGIRGRAILGTEPTATDQAASTSLELRLGIGRIVRHSVSLRITRQPGNVQ